MSSLYFYYSSMNAGKSSSLLQSAYNYKERGMCPLLITSAIDDRYDVGFITSRIGLSSSAHLFDKTTNMIDLVIADHRCCVYDCILIDEAQFLTREQVLQLCELVDLHKVPVLCYGLRTDFRGQLFEGSSALMALADKLSEMKSVCHCGRKATMVARVDDNGDMIVDGPQVEIGGNSRYVSVCRKHYMKSKPVKEGTPYVD